MTLDTAKKHLRLTSSALDDEVLGLIAGAKADLQLVGVVYPRRHPPPDETNESLDPEQPDQENDPNDTDDQPPPVSDPLIDRAIILYCKGHFGFTKDSERFIVAYDKLKQQLRLSGKYTTGGDSL